MFNFRARPNFTDSVQETGIKKRTARALRDKQTLALQVRPAQFVTREQPVGSWQTDIQTVPPKNL